MQQPSPKMNKKIYFCSDLYLGLSEARRESPSRDREFQDHFLTAWSHVVKNNDVIVILGNLAVGREARYFHTIAKLPGKKCVLLGPEDKQPLGWYNRWGFQMLLPFGRSTVMRHDYGNLLLSHIPAYAECFNNQPSRFMDFQRKHEQEMDRNSAILNIHGHTLGAGKERHNTIDVSLEATAFAPRELASIIEEKFKS
jgi:calcineurin-like phosphoesterase family protein